MGCSLAFVKTEAPIEDYDLQTNWQKGNSQPQFKVIYKIAEVTAESVKCIDRMEDLSTIEHILSRL